MDRNRPHELSRDIEQIVSATTRIGARSMGETSAAEFVGRNGVEGELLVRLDIDRKVALADISE